MTTTLAERYGAPPRWRRRTARALAVLVSVAALGWLAWAMWFHGSPDVESDLVAFEVRDDHETSVTLQVTLRDGVDATCRLRAVAEDHTTVGELAFTPDAGRNDVVVRTERRATSIEDLGCSTPDQPRPR